MHNHFVQSGFSSSTATMFSVIIFSVICVWHLFRFEREAAAVNSELRVKQLQHALRKAEQKHTDLKKVCYFHKSKKKLRIVLSHQRGKILCRYGTCGYMFSVVNLCLVTLFQEFEAYKKYSSDLLAQEKELNGKLRHMIN